MKAAILNWLATSAFATALKVGVVAGLVWLVDNTASLGLHPAVEIALIAGIPTIVDAINPNDPRFGKGSAKKK